MATRKAAEGGLTTRQKLTLFHGSGLTAEAALITPDDQISFDLMLTNGVKALNICTAGLRPMALKQQLGVTQPSQLRRLGFDALHLVDPVWCQEANAAFGPCTSDADCNNHARYMLAIDRPHLLRMRDRAAARV